MTISTAVAELPLRGYKYFRASGEVARVIGTGDEKMVSGLPAPRAGVVYLVTADVQQALPDRSDLCGLLDGWYIPVKVAREINRQELLDMGIDIDAPPVRHKRLTPEETRTIARGTGALTERERDAIRRYLRISFDWEPFGKSLDDYLRDCARRMSAPWVNEPSSGVRYLPCSWCEGFGQVVLHHRTVTCGRCNGSGCSG